MTQESNHFFLRGGGEIGALTRAFDWRQTSLGPPDTWPLSLRTTLGIVLHSAFPMFLFWGDELTCFYNDAYRPSLGNNGKHPALGKPGRTVWTEIWDFIGPHIERVMATGESVWFEDQLVPIYRNGQLEDVYWTFSYSPAYGDDGQIAGMLVTCTETTEKVHTIDKLRHSEQRFQNLVRDASVGTIVLSGETMTVSIVNDAYARLIGRSGTELLNKPLFSIIPETEAVFRPIIDNVRLSGESLYLYGQPYSVHKANGGVITGFLDLVYQPYREQDGITTGVMVLCQDVTERRQAEQALRESESKFRTLIEEATVATLLLVGRELVIELANDIMVGYLGKGPGIIGKPLAVALPELEGQPFLQILDNVFTSGTAYEAKAAPVDLVLNGILDTYYFDFSYKPLRNAAGEVYAIMEMAVDVTEQIRSRQELEESELFARSVFESSPVAKVVFTGENMVIRTINPNMLEMLGRDASIVGKPFMEAMPELLATPLMERLRQVMATGQTYVQPEEKLDLIRFGQPYTGYYNYIYKALSNRAGGRYGVIVTATEVTQQALARQQIEESEERYRNLSARLEQQIQERIEELAVTNEELLVANEDLIESNKLLSRSNENLQQFAYVASHDLQEPLRKIQSFGDLLNNQYGNLLGEGVDYLQRMQSAASRMSTLIKDLLTFSRISTQRDTSTRLPLRHIVETVIGDLDMRIQEVGAEVTVDPLPVVEGDPSQLNQLFLNLLSNALKFRRTNPAGVPIKPVIRVRAQQVAVRALPPSVKPTRAAKTYHRIDVTDNGIGFDEKYVDRIFQVFQRLHGKSQFAGTGIGLAICERVAANHGGAITATSQPGQGATFSVYLPA